MGVGGGGGGVGGLITQHMILHPCMRGYYIHAGYKGPNSWIHPATSFADENNQHNTFQQVEVHKTTW